MVFDFIFSFGRLNPAFLSQEQRKNAMNNTGLTSEKAVEIFEYRKNNDGYWDKVKLHKQVVNKALPVAEALYLAYSLLFFFDNATSHSVYAKDALQARKMNKNIRENQKQLCNGWFDQDNTQIDQPMSFQEKNSH